MKASDVDVLESQPSLRAETVDWLSSLPESVCPMHLSAKFPALADELAMAWDDVEQFDQLMATLMFRTWGSTQGMPSDVLLELGVLYAHHAKRSAEA